MYCKLRPPSNLVSAGNKNINNTYLYRYLLKIIDNCHYYYNMIEILCILFYILNINWNTYLLSIDIKYNDTLLIKSFILRYI